MTKPFEELTETEKALAIAMRRKIKQQRIEEQKTRKS